MHLRAQSGEQAVLVIPVGGSKLTTSRGLAQHEATARWKHQRHGEVPLRSASWVVTPGRTGEPTGEDGHSEASGAWLSLVEHLVRDQGVGGSNPLAPTIYPRACMDQSSPAQSSDVVQGVGFRALLSLREACGARGSNGRACATFADGSVEIEAEGDRAHDLERLLERRAVARPSHVRAVDDAQWGRGTAALPRVPIST